MRNYIKYVFNDNKKKKYARNRKRKTSPITFLFPQANHTIDARIQSAIVEIANTSNGDNRKYGNISYIESDVRKHKLGNREKKESKIVNAITKLNNNNNNRLPKNGNKIGQTVK